MPQFDPDPMQLDSPKRLLSKLLTPLLMVAPFFLWGTAMVAMKGTMSHTTPFFVAGVRLLPAGFLVLATAWLLGKPQPQTWKAWAWILLFALVDGALFQGFLAQGLARTGAGLGSVLIDSQPLLVAVLSWWLFREKIGAWGWLGLGIGILGISAIGLPDEWIIGVFEGKAIALAANADGLFRSGEALMLLASISMGVGTVMVRFVSRHVDPVVATGWHMILGGIPLFVLSGVGEVGQWQDLDRSGWLALGYAAVFGSAIAYGLFFYFAARGNLTSLSALTFLTPVFALLFSYLFLTEVLSALQWAGVCLTLVSVALIEQRHHLADCLSFDRVALWLSDRKGDCPSLPSARQTSMDVPVRVRLKKSESEV